MEMKMISGAGEGKMLIESDKLYTDQSVIKRYRACQMPALFVYKAICVEQQQNNNIYTRSCQTFKGKRFQCTFINILLCRKRLLLILILKPMKQF